MQFKTVTLNGLNIFFREDGDPAKPTFLLLHGFPTSSHMFRNLMPLLAHDFHVLAPDYIGFGRSSAPNHQDFDYTFANQTKYVSDFLHILHVQKFYLYVFDYGAPIGFDIADHMPDKVLGIVSQNGNIYEEGLGKKWAARKAYWQHPTPQLREKFKAAFSPEAIKRQYLTGEKPGSVGPDGLTLDIHYTESPDYAERQSDLIFDYQNNLKNYPRFQSYLRAFKPDLIAAWGRNDESFVYQGALAFAKDDPNVDIHLLNGGHFVLESHYREIAQLILNKWA
jgi:pimeloyl-ACP methyl ester carboxylesterase